MSLNMSLNSAYVLKYCTDAHPMAKYTHTKEIHPPKKYAQICPPPKKRIPHAAGRLVL